MISRLLKSSFLTGSLVLGFIGIANAMPATISLPPVKIIPISASAPELDPTAFSSGIIMLAGGLLMFGERRRKKD
jgi:hypothetical protein